RSLSAAEVANEYQMMSYGSTEKDASGSPAPDVPVALWHFDDNSTTTAFDFFGDNNASVNGSSTADGVWGTKGFSFDGVNDMIRVANASNFKPTTALTLGAWVKPNAFPAWAKVFSLDYRSDGTWTAPYIAYDLMPSAGTTGRPTMEVAIGGSLKQITSTVILSTGVWSYLVGTFDGTNISIYVNGVLANSTSASGTIDYGTSRDLAIGAASPYISQEYFNGSMDELEIYNRALSAAEINQSYRRSFPLFGLNTSRFGANDSLTFQLEPIQFDGIPGTPANSSTVSTTIAAIPQSVFVSNVSPNGLNFSQLDVVRISANVTSSNGVDKVYVNITLPGGSLVQINLSNASSQPDIWNATFTSTRVAGSYTMVFIGNDSSSINSSVTASFNVTQTGPGSEFCDVGNFTSRCIVNHSVTINSSFQNLTVVNLVIDANGSLTLASGVTNFSINASGNVTVTGNITGTGSGSSGGGTQNSGSGSGGGG
ncbi:MAG: LamG domain-containing protein, partial [Nanoarchaeota archaeon]